MHRKYYHPTIKQFKAFNAYEKVKKRASLLTLFLFSSLIAIFIILKNLSSNILYFKSPTDIKVSQDTNFNKKIRIGEW